MDWNKLRANSPCSPLTINEPNNRAIVTKLEAGHKREYKFLNKMFEVSIRY